MAGKPSTPLFWIASSLKDLKALPVPLQKAFGTALHLVQLGDTPLGVKALKGFGGGGVLELAEDYERGTYRAVYSVKFEEIETWHRNADARHRTGEAAPSPRFRTVCEFA